MSEKRYTAITLIVAVAVLLLASSCTGSLIASLEAEAEWTYPLGNIGVTCNASSPDGYALSYRWSASGGNITGAGAEIAWSAPEEVGMYDIAVVVTDGHGGRDAESITLIASNGPPPKIEDLVITAVGHKYLKETTTGYKVAKTYDYHIECIASSTTGDPVYEWSCTGGEISEEGSLVTWTAPNTEGDVTVTVKVFDALANWVSESMVLDVVHCVGCVNW
ncbi:MAG: hypothetical protein ACXQTH_03245 [Dehalococcoidia bacterium]